MILRIRLIFLTYHSAQTGKEAFLFVFLFVSVTVAIAIAIAIAITVTVTVAIAITVAVAIAVTTFATTSGTINHDVHAFELTRAVELVKLFQETTVLHTHTDNVERHVGHTIHDTCVGHSDGRR